MDYDFSGLCADQLFKLEKRLASLHKSFVKEYIIGLNVINNAYANEHRAETLVQVEDLLRDLTKKCSIFYVENFNKIQRELTKHLK